MTSKNGQSPVRLSLCMVVRDCAETLKPLLKAMRPYCGEIILVLGGASKDHTKAIATKYGDTVIDYDASPIFWDEHKDWARARNLALKHVTGEFFIWLDGDDLPPEGLERLPGLLDAMEKRAWGRCDLKYIYDRDEHGNETVVQTRERIMRTDLGWHWEDRVHETCHTPKEHIIGFSEELVVVHGRRAGGSSERNLPILKEMLRDDPKQRTVLHLAHAYFSLADYDAAQVYYADYVANPEDDLNQWNAAMMAARCAMMRGDWLGTQTWSMMALGITPAFKDPYIFMAHATWNIDRDADKTAAWLEKADNAHDAPLSVFRNPLDYTINRWDVEHRVLASRGRFKEALACVSAAYEIQPGPLWWNLMDYYSEAVRCEHSVMSAIQIVDHLVRRGDIVRAKQFVDYLLPQTIRKDHRILAVKERLESFLIVATDAKETYEKHDGTDISNDMSPVKRVEWYIQRLTAAGAKTVLEVGCHTGDVSRVLAKAGFSVHGIDFNANAIERAKELAGNNPLLRFDAIELGQVTEQYDAVLFAEILEHLTPQKQMDVLMRADDLAPMVLGSSPGEFLAYGKGLFEHDPALRAHIFEFDQSDMEQLLLTNPERHIVNCHKILDEGQVNFGSPGFGNRVFEYNNDRPMGLGVTIFLGEGPEAWTPRSIDEEGLGGSETAAVRLAESLAAKGLLVTVYAMEDGVYNGVVYRHHSKFQPDEERDVLIVSRKPWTLMERPNAHMVFLWCHDTSYGELFTPEIAANIDGVVVMSEWQRGHWAEAYPWLDAQKVHVIGNAITLYAEEDVWWCSGERCLKCKGAGCGEGKHTQAIEKQPHRFIWPSSPDRGLDDVLAMWPTVREMWGDAELHVYYGFNYLDVAARTRPERARFKAQVLKAARQPGVFLHGRIGQEDLAHEFARSQFWLYPSLQPDGTDWPETFCIAAVETQAYGCIPLTRKVAALAERIVNPECFVESWTPEDICARLKEWDEQGTPEAVEEMRRSAEAYTWASVADGWIALTVATAMPALEPVGG